ncbi:ABC transporter ATP-binding protein [Thermodesulfobacteriota bacterium]
MIQIENISKSYQSGRGRQLALADLSCRIQKGMTAAVVGKSGSGKTTLLNCIGGLENPDKGTVLCSGLNIHTLSANQLSRFQRRDLGFIFQHGNLLSYLNVFENIGLPLTLNGIVGKQRSKRVHALLERIGLRSAGRAQPHELSGGEFQRVAAARALAHYPKLLLADEPTASLDTETGRMLLDLMFEIGREQDCTLLISTHDQELFHLADKVIHLKDGRVEKEELCGKSE